jgi:integral membrane protein
MSMTPLKTFRTVAIAEAVTWALLLTGMVFKYSDVTDLGVRVFGMVHGVVFIAYCLVTVFVAVDQRWSRSRSLLTLLASIPPFFTVLADRSAERADVLGSAWRLTHEAPASTLDRVVSWLLRNPVRGALAGLVAVAALTGVALLVGPPAS